VHFLLLLLQLGNVHLALVVRGHGIAKISQEFRKHRGSWSEPLPNSQKFSVMYQRFSEKADRILIAPQFLNNVESLICAWLAA